MQRAMEFVHTNKLKEYLRKSLQETEVSSWTIINEITKFIVER